MKIQLRNDYLISRWALTLQFGCEQDRRETRGNKRGVVVGLNRTGPGWKDLRQAEEEARQVSGWLCRQGMEVVLLIGDEATKPAVLNALEGISFLSFSGHGQLCPETPAQSGILLRGPETLDLQQLMQMRLPGLEHVTLAACWSADSFSYPGRWVVSLPQLLFRIGARSVLASLWEVDDEVAKRIHLRFLEGLRRNSRSEALRQAQLAEIHEDPYKWACLQLYGEGGGLHF